MAASGRVDPEIVAMMGQTITVKPKATTPTDFYGKNQYNSSASRSVKALIEPMAEVVRTQDGTLVYNVVTAYCDDVDIDAQDQVVLPDGSSPSIVGVDTYNDEVGKLYQVVMLK